MFNIIRNINLCSLFSIMENLKDEDVQHYKEMFQMFDKVKFFKNNFLLQGPPESGRLH